MKFYVLNLCFISLINFLNQNCVTLQKNWLYIKRKNLCHQQWQENNINLACFIAITILSFLNNWKWEMLYEKQNIQWKYCINVLKLLRFYIQRKTIIRFGLTVFLFKRLNVFNLSSATKTMITPFSLTLSWRSYLPYRN